MTDQGLPDFDTASMEPALNLKGNKTNKIAVVL